MDLEHIQNVTEFPEEYFMRLVDKVLTAEDIGQETTDKIKARTAWILGVIVQEIRNRVVSENKLETIEWVLDDTILNMEDKKREESRKVANKKNSFMGASN